MSRDPDRKWRILDLIEWTANYFAERGIETPRLDAEVLLAHALGQTRIALYLQFERVVAPPVLATYRELVKRRAGRVPVAYLIGEKEFYSLPFQVTPGVLIPRPETEVLIEAALERLKSRPIPSLLRLLDVGTGSGAIAVTMAREWQPRGIRVVATDISSAALKVAQANADRNRVSRWIEWREGSLLEPIRAEEKFAVLLANLPYLPTGIFSELQPEVAEHEPRLALDGGPDGLILIRRLVADAERVLEPGALLGLEVGDDQAAAVSNLIEQTGQFTSLRIVPDYGGVERVVLAERAA